MRGGISVVRNSKGSIPVSLHFFISMDFVSKHKPNSPFVGLLDTEDQVHPGGLH